MLELAHLVLDLNGTIALDGEVLPGVAERLTTLAGELEIYLVTADTQGSAAAIAIALPVRLVTLAAGGEAEQKLGLLMQLGPHHTAAIGNGANDARMLAVAALGIAVLGPEGLASVALQAAEVVVARIEDALDLLLWPQRLIATLRR
jgi:P-type E1-E2 ATPase